MNGQSIRRSQFITTYGPGAILEMPGGPRIIPGIEVGLRDLLSRWSLSDFELTYEPLTKLLGPNARVFALPSNAQLGLPEFKPVYRTRPFPSWSLCTSSNHLQHYVIYRKTDDSKYACPQCPPLNSSEEAWAKASREKIRFVRACPDGHLDDVDWVRLIRHSRADCNPPYLLWLGGASALRYIELQCPICNAKVNFGEAYSRDWPCSGRLPEKPEWDARPGCDKKARIIQRGAANLHLPVLETAVTIPPRSTSLHRILERTGIREMLAYATTKTDLVQGLQKLVEQGRQVKDVLDEINSYDDDVVAQAIRDVTTGVIPRDFTELREHEFQRLREAALCGEPARPGDDPLSPRQFEVIKDHVRVVTGPNGRQLRITPVSRLRVVMVQLGYRRLDPAASKVVSVAYVDDNDNEWFPGVELLGEGIFIDLPPQSPSNDDEYHFEMYGPEVQQWKSCWEDPASFGYTECHPRECMEFHPVFVWWHTLSHRLINALAVDSGYSSAAIRERIYLSVDRTSGRAYGGVLLYTAQPGGDGTLGGLIALVPHFDKILRRALYRIDRCSNDPLCAEETFGPNKVNGAACYVCSLVSETSCEHRNMRLDRNLLRNNLP